MSQITLPQETVLQLQHSVKAASIVAVHGDWLAGGATELLTTLTTDLSAETPPTLDECTRRLKTALGLLESYDKSIAARMSQQAYALFTLKLARRDSLLARIRFKPSDQVLRSLRLQPMIAPKTQTITATAPFTLLEDSLETLKGAQHEVSVEDDKVAQRKLLSVALRQSKPTPPP